MSFYVDTLQRCPTDDPGNPRWRFSHYCHLIADSLGELHSVAEALGLRRAYFRDLIWLPHYDLTITKRRLAVRLGAKQLTRAELLEKAAAIRKEAKTKASRETLTKRRETCCRN